MSVISIRIKDRKRRLLKIISSLEDKTIGGLIEEWIDEHVEKNRAEYQEVLEKEHLTGMMRISEPAFGEWDNDEDEICDDL